MYKKLNLIGLILLLVTSTLMGFGQNIANEEWNQFRGPDRNGISTDNITNSDWNGNNLELIWKQEIGSGFSELLISKGIIYTMISEKTDSLQGYEYIAAFNERDGKELWRTKVDSIYIDEDGWGDGPRSTPIIDSENIYSLSGHGKLSANSKKDGKLIWQVDFVVDFGSTTPRWGFASSPIIVDNKLIMEVGGTESRAFMAFNKSDGSIIWSDGAGNASHDSPLKVTIGGQEQILFANGSKLYSYSSDGDTLWTYNMPFRGATAMPVLIQDNKIFVSAVRNPGFFIVQISNNKVTELLTGSSMKNDYSSCVYHNGYIYGYHVAAVRCISAETGEVKWTKRGFGKGSLMLVDDKLVVLSDKGKLVIVDANPELYSELATVQALEGKSWTAPSFLKGKIYVRNLTGFACYKIK